MAKLSFRFDTFVKNFFPATFFLIGSAAYIQENPAKNKRIAVKIKKKSVFTLTFVLFLNTFCPAAFSHLFEKCLKVQQKIWLEFSFTFYK